MWIVFGLITLLTLLYYFMKQKYTYWEKRGVKGPKPNFLFGNIKDAILLKKHIGKIYTDIYRQYPDEDYVGVYRATTPVLLPRSPDLVKEITVKSFSHFQDNEMYIDPKDDPLFGLNPFVLRGDDWKNVRAQLTSGFTGGKMKLFYPMMKQNGENFVKYLEKLNGKAVDAKALCIRFTLDNVASCGFSVEGKCLEQENCEFLQLGKDFFAMDSYASILFFIITIFPRITKIFSLRFITKSVMDKLADIVEGTLKYREDNNITTNDYLQILQQVKSTSKGFSNAEITAHIAGFFSDGFESSSITMSFALYELASNPEVQTKLRNEVKTLFEQTNHNPSYEDFISLPYLDACFTEALRLHPLLLVSPKICTKTFQYKSLTIEEGTPILLPVLGLHSDEKYYEEPKRYKPERFLEENRNKLTKYTLLSFGEGPRACIGQRFGSLQVKMGIAYAVSNFEIKVNEKTKVPVEYVTFSTMPAAVGGLWLNFVKL